ncbi:MAG: hypothetical protein LUJ09_02280, partial [Firmicutes bacterium]|nr:hypothetical protein [Bacillota bacterium]
MRQIFRRFRRRPAPAIGVLVFALILSAVLCGLQMSNEAEVEKYWDTFYTIPVEMAVTNLTGSRSENLQIPAEIANVFLPYGELAKYVTDVQMEAYLVPDGDYHDNLFYGISSMDRISSLQPENAEITWVEGYDEGIFAGDEMVCLAPESLILAMQITSQDKTIIRLIQKHDSKSAVK